MRKRNIITIFIAFLLGVIVAFGVIAFALNMIDKKASPFLKTNCLVDWEKRVYKAYKESPPHVALWALTNLEEILIEYDNELPKQSFMQHDILLTYTRLAIIYKQMGDKDEFKRNISKAIEIAKREKYQDISTAEDLVRLVEKLDNKKKASQEK